MDPELVAADLQRSRQQLRALLLAGQPGHEDADVFPRSATMRFLLDPRRRGIATSALGALASLAFRRRRTRAEKPRGIARSVLGLLGSLRR